MLLLLKWFVHITQMKKMVLQSPIVFDRVVSSILCNFEVIGIMHCSV